MKKNNKTIKVNCCPYCGYIYGGVLQLHVCNVSIVDAFEKIGPATTYTTTPLPEVDFNKILEAIAEMPPYKEQKIEVSKKHYKLLAKLLRTPDEQIVPSGMAMLYGIPVHIRPYLKKLRLYTEA